MGNRGGKQGWVRILTSRHTPTFRLRALTAATRALRTQVSPPLPQAGEGKGVAGESPDGHQPTASATARRGLCRAPPEAFAQRIAARSKSAPPEAFPQGIAARSNRLSENAKRPCAIGSAGPVGKPANEDWRGNAEPHHAIHVKTQRLSISLTRDDCPIMRRGNTGWSQLRSCCPFPPFGKRPQSHVHVPYWDTWRGKPARNPNLHQPCL